jgi:hypothetical protein
MQIGTSPFTRDLDFTRSIKRTNAPQVTIASVPSQELAMISRVLRWRTNAMADKFEPAPTDKHAGTPKERWAGDKKAVMN